MDKRHSLESREKISRALKGRRSPMKGRKQSTEAIEKRRKRMIDNPIKYWLGKKLSKKHRENLSKASKKGSESHLWRGGITPINLKVRASMEYKLWREAVYKRDNYTCVWCGSNKSGTLNADHIKPFAYYPELRFAIDNGRTLCIECHKTTDTYGERL